MGYIKGLDGFRGFLVICIVLFHLFTVFFPEDKSYFPGGFLAVESFFVLSGFLITMTLVNLFDNHDRQSLAFIEYLKRRFLRVFPALTIMVGATLSGLFILKPATINHIQDESISGLLFFYNLYLLLREIPYFEKFEEVSFLLHLWSLSIEFQLYILVGFVFLLFYKLSRLLVAAIFLLLAVSSAGINYVYFNFLDYSVEKVYFSTEARSFGFFMGALVGLYADKVRQRLGEVTGYTFGLVATLGLFITFITVDAYAEWFYPFGFILADTLTILLILSFLNSESIKASFMTFDWLGKRSYSLYLWHYPVFIFVNLYYQDSPIFIMLGLVLVALLSDFSYRFIEEPFRRLNFNVDIVPGLSYLVVVVVAMLPFFLLKSETTPVKNIFKTEQLGEKPEENPMAVDETLGHHIGENINLSLNQPPEDVGNIKEDTDNTDIFMIGDSVLLGAANYIKKIFPTAKIDAKVGRQAVEIPLLIEKHKDEIDKSQAVLIHIGNNGYFKKDILEESIQKIGGDKRIYLLTVNAAVPWKDKVNENIRQMKKFPNVRIIEWDKHNQPELFVRDKVHLSGKGILRYVSLIKSDIGPHPNHMQQTNKIRQKQRSPVIRQINQQQDDAQEEYSPEFIIKSIDSNLN